MGSACGAVRCERCGMCARVYNKMRTSAENARQCYMRECLGAGGPDRPGAVRERWGQAGPVRAVRCDPGRAASAQTLTCGRAHAELSARPGPTTHCPHLGLPKWQILACRIGPDRAGPVRREHARGGPGREGADAISKSSDLFLERPRFRVELLSTGCCKLRRTGHLPAH